MMDTDMTGTDGQLPHVDVHTVDIAASRERVWDVLETYAARPLGGAASAVLPYVLGTDPRQGFAVAERVHGSRMTLVGRHRFSRYRLTFELHDGGEGHTVVRARTDAAFPGLHGRVYRLLVIGTKAHVVATRGILRSIRASSLRSTSDQP